METPKRLSYYLKSNTEIFGENKCFVEISKMSTSYIFLMVMTPETGLLFGARHPTIECRHPKIRESHHFAGCRQPWHNFRIFLIDSVIME